jgi:hypothetical protein
MEEKISIDTKIKITHDKTIELIRKYFSDKIHLGLDDMNIVITVFDVQRKGFFKLKNGMKLAKFCIAYKEDLVSNITVTEDGRRYYDLFKRIGEESGYGIIQKSWVD